MKLHFAETDQPKKMRDLQSAPLNIFQRFPLQIETSVTVEDGTYNSFEEPKEFRRIFCLHKALKSRMKVKERSVFILGYRKRFLNCHFSISLSFSPSFFLCLLQMSRSQPGWDRDDVPPLDCPIRSCGQMICVGGHHASEIAETQGRKAMAISQDTLQGSPDNVTFP